MAARLRLNKLLWVAVSPILILSLPLKSFRPSFQTAFSLGLRFDRCRCCSKVSSNPMEESEIINQIQNLNDPVAASTESTIAASSTYTISNSRTMVDRSTFRLLEHVNLNIPWLYPSLEFYFDVLGCGMDPRKAGNLLALPMPLSKTTTTETTDDSTSMQPPPPQSALEKPRSQTVWANCGASQFHLPKGEVAQVIPGKIGLRFTQLDRLRQRAEAAVARVSASFSEPAGSIAASPTFLEHELSSKRVVEILEMDEQTNQLQRITLKDLYGNIFYCRLGGNPISDSSISYQPVIDRSEVDTWGWIAERYGHSKLKEEERRKNKDEADDGRCCGIDFVEFACPLGTASRIALFYESVFDAATTVIEQGGDQIAIIAIGNIDDKGMADQSLVFRETASSIPRYDGHHIALYVGESESDFEQAYKNCELAGVVWVNPRFDDKASTLQGAKKWKQFRFKNIVDMETGITIFELEHEMRSTTHGSWPMATTKDLLNEATIELHSRHL